MYQVVFDNGKDRKTLYKDEDFGKVLDEGWKLVRCGVPANQIDVLRLDESTGLWLSIWESECGSIQPPVIVGCCSAALIVIALIEHFVFLGPGPSPFILAGVGIIFLIGIYHIFRR